MRQQAPLSHEDLKYSGREHYPEWKDRRALHCISCGAHLGRGGYCESCADTPNPQPVRDCPQCGLSTAR